MSGDLGAGKTALVTAMVRLLGSRDRYPVPPFPLCRTISAETSIRM
ncbi:MAG: hypothetical protein IPJ06_03645 [Saprospiraceae bacterium]|nr:hypothetical protein [Saprospiraceae bacterium]